MFFCSFAHQEVPKARRRMNVVSQLVGPAFWKEIMDTDLVRLRYFDLLSSKDYCSNSIVNMFVGGVFARFKITANR